MIMITQQSQMLKRSEIRKQCALAVVRRSQKFSPCRRPLPGGAGQNLISWRWSLPLQTQFGKDWCAQFRVIVVRDPQTHPQTNRQDRLQYTALQLSTQCNEAKNNQHHCGWQANVDCNCYTKIVFIKSSSWSTYNELHPVDRQPFTVTNTGNN